MQNQQWLLERQLETARLLENHEGRIATIEGERKRRSSSFSTAVQVVMALSSIAAVIISILAMHHK